MSEDVAAQVVGNEDPSDVFTRLDTDDDGLISRDQLNAELSRSNSSIKLTNPKASIPSSINRTTFNSLVSMK